MRTVHKFPLSLTDAGINKGIVTVDMPKDAIVLSIQTQSVVPFPGQPGEQVPTIWAQVNTEADIVVRTFVVIGTGHPLPEKQPVVYWGTVQTGPFVWHIYEVLNT